MHSPLRRSLVFSTALASVTAPVMGSDGARLRVIYPRVLERPDRAYGFKVLDLALRKSGQPYELRLGDALSSAKTAFRQLETGQLNVIDTGSTVRLAARADLVPIPIDFGLGGCRLLLGRRDLLKRLHGLHRIEELQAFAFGQGLDWTDGRILRNAGLRVEEGEFQNLVRMLQGGRFDLLPLGSEEAYDILEPQRASAPDVEVGTDIGLVYAYPRVFYVNPGNTELQAALTRGLNAAHADGSLSALLEHTPGIGPILTGKQALPSTLIGLTNPWLPPSLRGLSLNQFHPALRGTLRALWVDAKG